MEQRHLSSPGEENQSQAGKKAALLPKAREGLKVTEKGGGTKINKTATEEKEDAKNSGFGKAMLGSFRLEVELSEVKVHLLLSGV